MPIKVFHWIPTNAKGFRKVVRALPFNRINVETLLANKALTISDKQNQHLTPSGSSREVTMPSTGVEAGDVFVIKNCAAYDSAYSLIIKQSATIIDIIYSNGTRTFIYNGSNWTSNANSEGGTDTKIQNTCLGAKSGAYNSSVAIGFDALSNVVNGFAKGNYSETFRHGEEVRFRSSSGNTVHSFCMYEGESQEDTNYTEIYLDGIGGSQQWKLWDASDSSVNFRIMVAGRNCIGVVYYTAAINIIGHIRRSGATTELKYDLSTSLYADGTLDAKVEGDDTNDALKLLVRGSGPTGGKIYWSAVIEAIEYRCTPT